MLNKLHIFAGIPKIVRGEIWNLLVSLDKESEENDMVSMEDQNRSPLYYTPYEKVLKELTSQQHAILIDLGEYLYCKTKQIIKKTV